MKMANLDAVFDDLFTNPKSSGDVSFFIFYFMVSLAICFFIFRKFGYPKTEKNYFISQTFALVQAALRNTFYGAEDGRLMDSV